MLNKNETIVDIRYKEGNSLIKFLLDQKELTLSTDAEDNFRKTFLLIIASFFEHEISQLLREFAKVHSNSNPMIMSFIEKNGISRKYHTLFEWEGKNINSFLSNFGEQFKKASESKINSDDTLFSGMRAFLELGNERNRLVHRNFAEYTLEKTTDEIYELYNNAIQFVAFLKKNITAQKEKEEAN